MEYFLNLLLLFYFLSPETTFAEIIENFETGRAELLSFPNEDLEPDSFRLDTTITHNNSHYSLKIFGNTWKIEEIRPIALDSNTVLTVASYMESVGEVQGFGLVSEHETLFYSFAGREKVNPEKWVFVYQGAFPLNTWNLYQLPVGEDWLSRFGHLATITGIVFVNDRDTLNSGIIYFDDILNITSDLPVPPSVEIWHDQKEVIKNPDGSYYVTVHFYSRIADPDSRKHFYFWSFGDDATSNDSCPIHTYSVRDAHDFTVLLEVCDSTGRWGRDSCRVRVDPGPSSFPLRVNFVGDVMLARRYEIPGGLIDTLGPEGVFAQIKPYLGDVADISVANLECPLTNRGTPHPTKPIVFRGRPTNVRGLTFAGIDVVSLANNHILDYGLDGLLQTQQVLDSSGIKFSGAGADAYEAFLPVFLNKRGINFGFLGFSDRTGQYDNYQPYLNAGSNKPGFAELDTFRVFQAINKAKEVSDFLVVQVHSGEEYQERPDGKWDDEWYLPRREKPNLGERQIRHRIIDMGADLVVCHHPHILQGLEAYHGKLIAHSLGNFAFDQEYPETYPSVILNGLLDNRGFYHYFLVPVYIDDYIPKRAKGGLGTAILRHLSRLSKELGTYLVVDRESVEAEVILDTSNLVREEEEFSLSFELQPESTYWQSMPLPLSNWGDISQISQIMPTGEWQFRLGRDLIWFGNMEDEGATMWNLNQGGEFYDTIAFRGHRSLCQIRSENSGQIITNFEERMVVPSDSNDLELYAQIKADNGHNINLLLNLFSVRTGGFPVRVCSLLSLNGTFDWRPFHKSFSLPSNAQFFDLYLRSSGPPSGLSRVWFDDVSAIAWESWQDFTGPLVIPNPNEYSYLQIRTPTPRNQAEVIYRAVRYLPAVGQREEKSSYYYERPKLWIEPVFGKENFLIRYHIPRLEKINLSIYNSAGQKVRILTKRRETPGEHILQWDLRDDRGGKVSSGTYFCQLRTEESSITKKVLVIK
ncbi:MAG: CapA family protein [candidate division WOR-3 bacterium]